MANVWDGASQPACYTRLLSDQLVRTRKLRRLPEGLELQRQIEAHPPCSRISYAQWVRWLDAAAGMGMGPADFLATGDGVRARHLGLLGHLFLSQPTLRAAFETYHRFERLHYGVEVSRLVPSDNGITTLCWPVPKNRPCRPAEMIAFSCIRRLVEQAAGCESPFHRVDFSGPSDQYACAFRSFFRCPVQFDSDPAGVCFSDEMLQVTLPSRFSVDLAQVAQRSLKINEESDPTVRHILRLLPVHLHAGGAIAERVGADLNLSPRSLHHRLARTSWRFRDLLESVRQQAALYYLREEELSLAEVAFLLGYAEQSNFQRAFRNWFDVSPGVWRREYRQS